MTTNSMQTKKVNKTKYDFVLPSMRDPIHIETLQFCNKMAQQFRRVERHHADSGLFGTGLLADNGFSKQAGQVAMAYETVAKHIEQEIKRRSL